LSLNNTCFAKGELLTIKDSSGNVLAVGKALLSSQQMSELEGNTRMLEYKRVLT